MAHRRERHEIRDPIHDFVRLSDSERDLLDSRPLQRLRYIHQLGLTYLLYPGTTHRRFEHTLGVMHLASRVYDAVTDPQDLHPVAEGLVPTEPQYHEYWRKVIRMAALCHDIGHLPFSHAAEEELLPDDWTHEDLTRELVMGDELGEVFSDMKLQPEDVAKVAVGPEYMEDAQFSPWESLLSEIITSDAFGVDRMDYLLRDSHHAGVAYGEFDHHRLIDTIRILPTEEGSEEPTLGVERGGLHSAESLLLARYFMYTQLYFHPIRRIYDIHLKDFLSEWLDGGMFSTDLSDHLSLTDVQVLDAISETSGDESSDGHDPAARIFEREHFQVLYERNPTDIERHRNAPELVRESAEEAFGSEAVRFDRYLQSSRAVDFPVLGRDDRVVSSLKLSKTLKDLPVVAVDFVFIRPDEAQDAEEWLADELDDLLDSGDDD